MQKSLHNYVYDFPTDPSAVGAAWDMLKARMDTPVREAFSELLEAEEKGQCVCNSCREPRRWAQSLVR